MNGTSISVDGNQVQEAEFNATNRSIPTPDSIGELRVESGVLTADKGRYAGGLITMETQSGTNQYHGRMFFYFRNQNLNSNDWTDNSLGNPGAGLSSIQLRDRGGRPGQHPSSLQRQGPYLLLFRVGRPEIFPRSDGCNQCAHLCSQQGDFSQTVINYNMGFRSTANIYDPFYGTSDPNPNDCTGPLAGTTPCWVRPQCSGNKIPSSYGSSVSCGTGLTWPESRAEQLFMKYMDLWPAPNHSPAANSDHWNNRYDKINVTLPRPTNSSFAWTRLSMEINIYKAASAARCSPTIFQHRGCMRLNPSRLMMTGAAVFSTPGRRRRRR